MSRRATRGPQIRNRITGCCVKPELQRGHPDCGRPVRKLGGQARGCIGVVERHRGRRVAFISDRCLQARWRWEWKTVRPLWETVGRKAHEHLKSDEHLIQQFPCWVCAHKNRKQGPEVAFMLSPSQQRYSECRKKPEARRPVQWDIIQP